MHDLEIRGAGEVLGESQSGEMQEVGFNLYADMLDHAVRSLKAGREPDLSQPFAVTTEVNLHSRRCSRRPTAPNVHERLVLYKRFANCASAEQLEAMQEELVDRFGGLPGAARALIERPPSAHPRPGPRRRPRRRRPGIHPAAVRAPSPPRPGRRAEARAKAARLETHRAEQTARRARHE